MDDDVLVPVVEQSKDKDARVRLDAVKVALFRDFCFHTQAQVRVLTIAEVKGSSEC